MPDVGSNVMTLHTATEILSKTEFNNQSDWDTYPTADYCCDKCNQIVSIDFKSLTKHQFSDFSNFVSADKELFKSLEGGDTKTNSFLDFYCPTCKRPVKIYYDSWAGGRHGEAGFTIKFIAH
jgi:hypothetical protein